MKSLQKITKGFAALVSDCDALVQHNAQEAERLTTEIATRLTLRTKLDEEAAQARRVAKRVEELIS